MVQSTLNADGRQAHQMSLLTLIDGESPKMCEQAQAGKRAVRIEP